MTPNPQRMGALVGACICATTGKVDIFIDFGHGNCISCSAVNHSQRRPWL